jgi:DsbC/DsbD-like thiol-disulfide interchange protein
MKHFVILACSFLLVLGVTAQIKDPVKWTYSSRNKGNDTWEVVLTATLPKPWHIYSQKTEKGGPLPTKISFKPNPLITLKGTVKEIGQLKTEFDKNFEVNVKYYGNKVEFIQTLTTKPGIKTNITGTIEYMVCDENQCLAPTKKNFDIKLQ